MKTPWWIAGVWLAVIASAAEPTSPDVPAAIREAGRAWLADNNGVGLTIGVYDNGQRSFYNFGAVQLDGNRPPTKDTVYEIGSIAKTMTGQLLARAIVEGRATLNDEVGRYLEEPYPNLENDGEKLRLLHLVNSTSQLMDNIPDLTQVRAVPGEPLAATRMRVVEQYHRREFLRQLHVVKPRLPPGSTPSQSNVGTMLLGVVLENIYKEPFEQILAREIEKPLRLSSGVAPKVNLLARGHTQEGEPLPPFAARMQFPSGSLRYSADDLLRYAAWQLVERDASVKLAHQPTWSTPDGRQSVAFYWVVSESPHGRRLQYSGATYGFASACELYPDAKLATVLLVNKNADGAQASLRALSARIVSLLRPVATERPAEVSPQPSSAVAPPQAR